MKFCFLLLKHVWELLVLHLNASNRFNTLQTTFNHPCGVRLGASPGLNNQPFVIYHQCVTTGYLSVIILITAWENAFTFGHTLTWIDWFLYYSCKNLKVTWECFLALVTNCFDFLSNKVTCSQTFLFFLARIWYLFSSKQQVIMSSLLFKFFLFLVLKLMVKLNSASNQRKYSLSGLLKNSYQFDRIRSEIMWPAGLGSDFCPVLGTGEVTLQVLCPIWTPHYIEVPEQSPEKDNGAEEGCGVQIQSGVAEGAGSV